ncbi:hypothetical protein [Methylocystis echinoides]|jgi:hypothetical protein|uniref:Uncharacterized protein n=1 Tax=Methylocystis echinoides TaxID=29468 RepID=A0A9W6GSM6_9HYPH|nr:hypothetical protein [Methylocystis echinoides]GLI92193.1 hypothetical protein LMG27198_11850 [Methylocystis echinoides]
MKGKSKGGGIAAALGKLLDAVRETLPGPAPAPVLRPIPVPARRPQRPAPWQ